MRGALARPAARTPQAPGFQASGGAAPARLPCLDTQARLTATAITALALGGCVYLLDREWASTLFLGPFAGLQAGRHEVFGALGATLPSFLHAYAIGTLLIVALWPWRQIHDWVLLGWFAVAATFEILQVPAVATALFDVPHAASGGSVTDSIARYAMRGEFDPADLMATAVGCAVAGLATMALPRRNT